MSSIYSQQYQRASSRCLRTVGVLAVCAAMLCGAARAGTVNIALVPVGDAGNVADPLTGYGSVSYAYNIGEYDVTMGQYTAFLNAVAATGDPYGLYNAKMATATPSYGITQTSTSGGHVYALATTASANVPVTYVSWGDAARFVNWLQNGEPTGLGEVAGSTETGTYALNGSTGSAALMAVTRSGTASWVLPTVNEWYKAAYYAGGGTSSSYWYYPTRSDSIPSNTLSAMGTNNANYTSVVGSPPVITESDPLGWLTPVGAFAASPGPYGTFDQGGDVNQWEETSVAGGQQRGIEGGSFAGSYGGMYMTISGYGAPPTFSGEDVGFRAAYVPEPGSGALLVSAALAGAVIFSRSKFTKR